MPPSFSRLFTHETWRVYVSTPPLERWFHMLITWHRSSVLRALLPCCVFMALWALAVSLVDARYPEKLNWLMGMARPLSALPIELQGSVIGFFTVFRTNSGYERLAEARKVLGQTLCLSRDITQSIACTWPRTPLFEEPLHAVAGGNGNHRATIGGGSIGGDFLPADKHPGAIGSLPALPALQVVRYLVAFAWSLKAAVREPVRAESLQSPEDVLRTLLPAEEVASLLRASDIPVALQGSHSAQSTTAVNLQSPLTACHRVCVSLRSHCSDGLDFCLPRSKERGACSRTSTRSSKRISDHSTCCSPTISASSHRPSRLPCRGMYCAACCSGSRPFLLRSPDGCRHFWSRSPPPRPPTSLWAWSRYRSASHSLPHLSPLTSPF